MSERRQSGFQWAALAIAACLVLFPLMAGMTAITDDVSMLLPQTRSLPTRLLSGWHGRFFRPLLTLSAPLLDTGTRAAVMVGLVQLFCLAAGIPALERVATALFSGRVPRFAATTLLLLHPATVVSLWQADTLSQTASAVCGIWTLSLALGASGCRHECAAWLSLTVLGLLTKETYVGWLVLSVPLAILRHRGLAQSVLPSKAQRRPSIAGPLAAGAIVVAYVVARFYVIGQLAGEGLAAGPPQRYALSIDPLTLLKNGVHLAAGLLTYGPIHALRLYGPLNASFWLGAVGLLAHGVILGAFVRRRSSDRGIVVALWFASLLVLTPVLPLGHVSELYLMGPNMLVALAIARAVTPLLDAAEPRSAKVLPAVLLVCAVLGQASRGYQFASSWRAVRGLVAQVEAIRGGHAPEPPRLPCGHEGPKHSVYVVPPLVAFRPDFTEVLERARGRALPEGWQRQLDCADLSARRL